MKEANMFNIGDLVEFEGRCGVVDCVSDSTEPKISVNFKEKGRVSTIAIKNFTLISKAGNYYKKEDLKDGMIAVWGEMPYIKIGDMMFSDTNSFPFSSICDYMMDVEAVYKPKFARFNSLNNITRALNNVALDDRFECVFSKPKTYTKEQAEKELSAIHNTPINIV